MTKNCFLQPSKFIDDHAGSRGNPAFFVNDNRFGIMPEHFERTFGHFKMHDNTSEGTGIGLAFVQQTIEFHGGGIWVKSEPGKGAAFYFTLADKPQ
jgi:signal transduction histidine kinase